MWKESDGALQQRAGELARLVRATSLAYSDSHWLDRDSLRQLCRAGTSVGANVREARFAESRRDFVHKLKVAEKELGEFYYWLGLLCSEPRMFSKDDADVLVDAADHIRRLLTSILRSCRQSRPTDDGEAP